MAEQRVIRLVFTGPPGQEAGQLLRIEDEQGRTATPPPERLYLVEVEDEAGHSITVGEWQQHGGYWVLTITC